MTATLDRPTTKQSVWGRALPALPRAAAADHAEASCAYVGQWLAVLADDPAQGGTFDRELEAYAGELRASGAISAHQGAGFLLALWSYQNVGNPLTTTLVAQVDRRAVLRGMRHCKWRGTVSNAEYEAPRYDEALRRVSLPRKGEEGYRPRRD